MDHPLGYRGVGFVYRRGLNFNVKYQWTFRDNDGEFVVAQIGKMYVVSVYVHPSGTGSDIFAALLILINEVAPAPIVIAGDFNPGNSGLGKARTTSLID